jgi:lipopolysaccharide/colanic/teichoic acid biosynthesis glycosyltransferase
MIHRLPVRRAIRILRLDDAPDLWAIILGTPTDL